jgi:hypothetical protein
LFSTIDCIRIYRLARDHPLPLASTTYKGAHSTPPFNEPRARAFTRARVRFRWPHLKRFASNPRPGHARQSRPRQIPAREARSRQGSNGRKRRRARELKSFFSFTNTPTAIAFGPTRTIVQSLIPSDGPKGDTLRIRAGETRGRAHPVFQRSGFVFFPR